MVCFSVLDYKKTLSITDFIKRIITGRFKFVFLFLCMTVKKILFFYYLEHQLAQEISDITNNIFSMSYNILHLTLINKNKNDKTHELVFFIDHIFWSDESPRKKSQGLQMAKISRR